MARPMPIPSVRRSKSSAPIAPVTYPPTNTERIAALSSPAIQSQMGRTKSRRSRRCIGAVRTAGAAIWASIHAANAAKVVDEGL